MKKTFKCLFVIAFAFVLLLGLTGCADGENNNGGNGTQGGNGQEQGGTLSACDKTKSTESFVDKYDYAEAYMIPDDGVYTSYKDQSIMDGVEYFYFVVDCLTQKGLENYKNKLVANGYENKYGSYINEEKNTKIVISNYVSSMNYINVYVYPSID